jgi:hypothetical protein
MRALLMCLAVLFAAPASAWDLNDLNKRADQNLYQLGEGCSATLVNVESRLVLTAYHCITQYVKTEQEKTFDDDGEPLLGPDGKPRTKAKKTTKRVPLHQIFWDDKGEKSQIDVWADIVARDAQKDVAILKIPAQVGPVVVTLQDAASIHLAAKDAPLLQRGATVWHVGNPMMMYGSVTKGIYSGARNLTDFGMDGVKFYVQYDGGLTGGSSGGALYDDAGTYIGIAVMVAPAATFLGFAVPMADVWAVADAACLSADLGGENPARCAKAVAKAGPGSLVGDTAK